MSIINVQDNWEVQHSDSGDVEVKTEARHAGRSCGFTPWMPLPTDACLESDEALMKWILVMIHLIRNRRVAIQKIFSGFNVAMQAGVRSSTEEKELRELARLQKKYGQ